MRQKTSHIAAFVGAMLLTGSFAMAATSHLVSGTPAAVTPDGLHRVEDPAMAMAWVKPGVNFARYTKIQIVPTGMTFKGVNRRSGNEYPITDQQKEALSKVLLASFTKELGKLQHYTLVTEPGPDVLQVRGALLDIVSHIPPERTGRSATFLRDIGEATLVVELQDSVSQEILARGVDRRAAASNLPRKSNPVTNRVEIEFVARQWASELRQRLDALQEAPAKKS